MNQASTVTLDFNPLAPEVTANPYPFYDRFRSAAPVFKTPLGRWFLTRHSDVSLVLRDRRFGRTFAVNSQKTYGPDALKEPSQAAISRMMLFMDPPDHARVRGLFAKAFSPRRMEEMRSRIQSIADRLIDDVEPRGQMDVVADFAYRLPIIVTCEMLGIPDEDRTQCLASFRMSGRMIDALPMNGDEMKQANEQVLFLERYFHGLFELRRREPRNDLT
ncbi:MAG: cytochrome P450, partial [Sulfurifustaceae bacterium]